MHDRIRRKAAVWLLSGFVLLGGAASALGAEVLVDFGSTWKLFRGKTAPSTPATAWRQAGFADAAWENAPAPVGYEAGTDGVLIVPATNLADMQQVADDPETPQDESQPGYLTFYLRRSFTVTQAQIDAILDAGNPAPDLILAASWDDGFVCYLNGTEVARADAGTAGQELAFDDPSTAQHEADGAEYFDLSAFANLLVAGSNLLAVEVHNTNLTSSDCVLDLRLAGNDPRLGCPDGLTCAAAPGQVTLAWTNVAGVVYDQIAVLRNGAPIPGSPFAPDTATAVDTAPGSFFNTYQVIASVGGVSCDPMLCVTEECPGGIACASSPEGVTITWTNSANVAYDSVAVTRNGTPIAGSPFPGNTQTAFDAAPGDFLNTYEVTARIGGRNCDVPLVCESTNQFVIIETGDDWRFFRGKTAPSAPETAWRDLGFNDAAWETGPTGIGYGDDDDATVLDDMQQVADDPATPEDETQAGYLSVFCRKTFNLPSASTIRNLTLSVDYDDGHIVYLNGTEVARSATMGDPGQEFAFDDPAEAGREAGTASVYDLTGAVGSLRNGANVLAVQVHNDPITSSDLSFIPRLTANGCFSGGGLTCAYVAATDDVVITFDAFPADTYQVTKDGVPLAGSPFAGTTTRIVDQTPGNRDVTYEIVATVGARDCPAATCSVTCGTRDPDALNCVLRLVPDGQGGQVTTADLSWTSPAGTTSIEVRREGALLATLPAGSTTYNDPDVESDQPEDDTDFTVRFIFADESTCTIACGPLLLCPQDLACEVVDVGGAARARLTWGNIVKEWERIDIDRDGTVIGTLGGTATAFTDATIEQVPGQPHTYTVTPVAPAGEGAPGDATEVNCSASCTVAAQVPEIADYVAPAGGWDYFAGFDSPSDDRYAADTGIPDNLDGEWIRAATDSWDGSAPLQVGAAPGGPAPGGIEATTASSAACGGAAGVLRILDPGDPSDPDGFVAEFPTPFDEPNNRILFLGYDTGVTDANLLRDGVTFAARWRVVPQTESPEYIDPSATGDGSPLEGDDRGQVGIYFLNDGSLAAGNSAALSFSLQSGDIFQLSTNPVSTLQAHDVDRWVSVWATVRDPEGDNTYDINLYLNGQTQPAAFFGTGTGLALQTADLTATIDTVVTPYFGAPVGNYLAIGSASGGQDADIQIDYIAYKKGVHAPSISPCGGGSLFRRADANADGAVNITDGIYILNFLFLGGETPTCNEAADANNDGAVNITDGIYTLNFLFLGGPDPLPPGPNDCGADADAPGSAGDTGCGLYGSC